MTARACPICAVPLAPTAYEGLAVLRCPQCQGHLLELARYDALRRIPRKTIVELEAEAQTGFSGDTAAAIRCPRCHAAMSKRPLSVPAFALHVDVCVECALVWFDGGELALAQLAHQASPAFREVQEQKRRAEALAADPARQAAFDEAVAKLPEPQNPVRAGLTEAVWDAFLRIAWGLHGPTRL